MKRIILLCFCGFGMWVCFLSANSNELAHFAPTIKIGADGSFPTDGSECVQVDADGIARVNFVSPPRKKNQYDDGFEYDRYAFYLSLISADRGSFYKQNTLFPSESSIYREVVSSENAGKTICFKLTEEAPVPSYFESLARYFGVIGALRGLEATAGNLYKDFTQVTYPSAIPAMMMLHNQLEMGKDVRQLAQLNTNARSSTVGFASSALLSTGYLFSPESLYPDVTELGTTGSFTLFYAAPITDGFLIAVDDGLITPYIGEQISPANGTERQLGSRLTSHAFRGPVMLSNLYLKQNIWNHHNGEKWVNQLPSLIYSLTIVTTHGTRTFIRELSSNFLDNDELLGYIHDGLLMITIASTDDPSSVVSIYFDESLKGRSGDMLGSYQYHSAGLKEVDQRIAFYLSRVENIIVTAPILVGLWGAYSKFKPAIDMTWGNVQMTLPSVVLSAMYKISRFKQKVSGKLAELGQGMANMPGISHMAKLRPKTIGSGIPLVPHSSVGQALSLSFSFNVSGPAFRAMVRYLSTLMTSFYEPGSLMHSFFQTGQQFVIGHYVLP